MRELFKFRKSGRYCGHKRSWEAEYQNFSQGDSALIRNQHTKLFNENRSKLFKNNMNWNV
jgi:hypothetical protein